MATCDEIISRATARDKVRFWSRVKKTKTCWTVTPAKDSGYGKFQLENRPCFAHRCAKFWQEKPASSSLHCCHRCKNKNCVRPSHLYWGTQKQNCADKIKDGTDNYAHLLGVKNRHSKLTDEQVKLIYEKVWAAEHSLEEIAKEFQVGKSAVCQIGKAQSWRHITSKLFDANIHKKKQLRLFVHGSNGHRAKLNEQDVMQIRHYILQRTKYADVAKQYGVSTAVVSHIAAGISWAHVPRLHGPMQRVTRSGGRKMPK